jgi:hypothetical protein
VDGKILCMPSLSSVRQLAAALYVDIAGKIQVTLEPLQSAPTPGTVVGLSVPVANPAFDTMFPCSGFGLELLVTGLPRSETQYYTRTHGATPVPPGYGLYDVFPLTGAYVELDEVRAQISRSVAIRELHGADGSRVFPRGLYDTAHDVMIESVGEYNALQMLLPPKVDRTNTHLIPAQPPNEAWCARSDPLFITQSQSGCDYSGLRFVNDPQTHLAYQVTRRTGTTYLCVTGESGPWLYEERDPFLARCAAPDFDGQVITWVTIGARITKQAVKIEDTTVLPPGGSSFTDSALHVSCNPTVASDGVLRCLPSEAWIVYTDPACTSPVAATFDPKPTYASQGSVPGSSPIDRQGQIAMFSVGAARPAGPVYALTRDGCAAFGTMPSFEISELSASTFAALEIRDVPASARSAQRAARP